MQNMTPRRLALVTGAMLLLHAFPVSAEPIMAARKYSGPMPQSSISIRFGVLGGPKDAQPNNEEMIDYLDTGVQPPFEAHPEDFSAAPAIDVTYIHKPHPQFGFRLNGSASRLKYTSTGNFAPETVDTLLLNFDRKFEVDLFTLEASGIYFFTDASVEQFQPYVGAGFSLGLPHQKFTESRTDADTGQPYTEAIEGRPSDVSEWDVSPGAHIVLGALYYFAERWGVSGEGRFQFMESRFDQLQAFAEDTGEFENVSFVVKYTGFYFSLGATYGF
jgi:hypothetical protein